MQRRLDRLIPPSIPTLQADRATAIRFASPDAANSRPPLFLAKLIFACLASTAVFWLPSAAFGQENTPMYWDTTTTGLWSTTADWWTTAAGPTNVTSVPGSSNDAVFNGTGVAGPEIVQLSGAQSADGLYFNNTGTTTLESSTTASEALTIGNDGLTIAATAGAVTLGSSSDPMTVKVTGGTWTNNSASTLTVVNGFSNTSNGQTLTLAGSGNFLFSSAVSESGNFNLNATGTGTIILAANNSYNNTTVGFGATIQVGNGGTTGSLGSNGKTDNGALVFDESGSVSVAAISGIGTLSQIGSGTLTLSGANTYTGGTTLNSSGGGLTLGNAASLQYSTLTDTSGTLGFGTMTSATLGGLAGSNGISIQNTNSAAVALTVGGNNASTIYSGALSGAGSLIKVGAGMLTLTGASANTFANGLTASAGTVFLDYSSVPTNFISTSTALTLGGANLVFNGSSSSATSQTIASLAINAGGGTISLISNGGQTNALTITGTADARAIGGAVNFVLPTNTSIAWSPASLPNGIIGPWATTTIAGGATQYATSDGTNIVGYTGTTATSGAGLTDTTGTVNYELTAASGDDPVSGTVYANTIRYSGAGDTLDLSGATGFQLNGLMNAGSGLLTVSNGTLSMGTGNELVVTGSQNIAIGSVISNNGSNASTLTYAGTGTLTLTGTNTYTGGTVIGVGGTLRIGNGGTTGSLSATGTVTNNGAVIFNSTNSAFAFSNTISGTGSVTINTPNVTTTNGLLLATGNTYVGGTTIDSGSIVNMSASGGSGNLGTSGNLGIGPVAINSGATVNITAGSNIYNSFTGSGVINVTGGSSTFVQSLSGFTGTINVLTTSNNKASTNSFGTYGINDIPASTQTIVIGSSTDTNATLFAQLQTFGPNVTFQLWPGTGDTENLGELRLDAASVQGPIMLEGSNGAANLGNHQGNAMVSVISGVISDGGNNDGITLSTGGNGAGAVELSAANTYGGPTTQGSGTGGVPLELGNTLALQNSTLTFTSTASAATVNGNNVVPLIEFDSAVASNTFTLGGLSSGSAAVGANTLTLQNSAGQPITLQVGNNNANTTYAGILAGSGGLTKIGTGTLTLSDTNNTYTGATIVSVGTLALSSSGSNNIASSSSIQIAGGATLDVTGLGPGNNGTLTLGGAAAAQTLAGPSSGTATLNGSLSVSGTGSGGGTLSVNSGGMLSITDSLTFAGGSIADFALPSSPNSTPMVGVAGALTPAGAGSTAVNISYTAPFTAPGTYELIGAPNAGGIPSAAGFSLNTPSPNGYGWQLVAQSNQLDLVAVYLTDPSGMGTFNAGVSSIMVPVGGSYAGFSSGTGLMMSNAPYPGLEGTIATVLVGTNGEGNATTPSMTWRTRTLAETPTNDSTANGNGFVNGTAANVAIISDVANLYGMSAASAQEVNSPAVVDPFVLQMSFNPATLGGQVAELAASGKIYLASLMGGSWQSGVYTGGQWVNTIYGDTVQVPGSVASNLTFDTQTVYVGSTLPVDYDFTLPYVGTFASWELANPGFNSTDVADYLGVWGVDPGLDGNYNAWAIIAHNSEFAVANPVAVPEPSALVLAVFGVLAALLAIRRRPFFRGAGATCAK